MRSAITHRHAEALRRADGDVGAEITGRGQQRQSQRIGGDNGERALGPQCRDRRSQIADRTMAAGVLQQRAEYICLVEVAEITDGHGPAQRLGTLA